MGQVENDDRKNCEAADHMASCELPGGYTDSDQH